MKVELFTKLDCSLCENVKQTLKNKNIVYLEHRIGTDIDRETVLKKFPNAKTAPVILVDDVFVDPMNLEIALLVYNVFEKE